MGSNREQSARGGHDAQACWFSNLLIKADILMLAVLAADNLAENPMGIDQQFIYGNSLIDAVTLQLGLIGNY